MNFLNIFSFCSRERQGENSMKLRNAAENVKSCCHLERSFTQELVRKMVGQSFSISGLARSKPK